LAGQKLGDDGFNVGPFDLGFAVDAAFPEAIDYEV
jgi:hypothetical protein